MRTWVQRSAPGVVRGRGLRGGARSEARGAPARSLTSGSVPLLFPCSSRPRAALVGLRRACGLLAFVCRCRFEWIHGSSPNKSVWGGLQGGGFPMCTIGTFEHLHLCALPCCVLFLRRQRVGKQTGRLPPAPQPQTPRPLDRPPLNPNPEPS